MPPPTHTHSRGDAGDLAEVDVLLELGAPHALLVVAHAVRLDADGLRPQRLVDGVGRRLQREVGVFVFECHRRTVHVAQCSVQFVQEGMHCSSRGSARPGP